MVKRQVFISYENNKDNWRALLSLVKEMAKRSCLVVLIRNTTANRKWINYEIEKANELNKGIVGVNIHGLKNSRSVQSSKGANPFYHLKANKGERLSKYIERFDSSFSSSKYIYKDNEEKLESLIENAIFNKAPRKL